MAAEGNAELVLTHQQADVLYALELRGMPTVAEFRAEIGLSTATLDGIVFKLRRRGLVRVVRRRLPGSDSGAFICSTSPTPLHPMSVLGHVRQRLVRDIAPVDTETNYGDYTVKLFLPIELLDAYFIEPDGGDLSRVMLAVRDLQAQGLVPRLSLAAVKRRGDPGIRLALCVTTGDYKPRLRLIPDEPTD